MSIRFENLEAAVPTYDGMCQKYDTFHQQFNEATDAPGRLEVIRRWDALQRELDTWDSLTQLRFSQDTANEAFKQAQDYRDELMPKLTELSVAWKRELLKPDYRDELMAAFGLQVIAIWAADIATFDPAIETSLVTESKVKSDYTALLAGAQITVRDQSYGLSELRKFSEDPDRDLRYEAERARWNWYAANRESLDQQFDQLVTLRHEMALTLGDTSFVDLGYRRMLRIDYDRDDVQRFREAVRDRVTPLCAELVKQQQGTLSLDGPVMYWDEALLDPSGNPRPQGDYDWMIQQATAMFDDMGHGLGEFFRLMSDGSFMDLQLRPGKAGGGFCTSFASEGMPFIFANFNGTKGDVEVFTHEIGHAFQNYMSREQPLFDYFWPTYESCEIHSMGLEFLTWPQMERFFGDDAARFRRVHLEESLRFLPYGVAVDHFQHLVYESPHATPAERHAMWKEVEQTYMPWRQFGDLPHVSEGGFWQQQRHIYLSPFYYIDYTLALTCAMQLWVRAQQDFQQTMNDYVALCRRGGEAPFGELVRSARLRSPFDPGCLDEVVVAAETFLATS